MGKFLTGERVRSRRNHRFVGTVVDHEGMRFGAPTLEASKREDNGMVRFRLDVPTLLCTAFTLPEGDVEYAPDRKFKVGDRVVWTYAPSGSVHGIVRWVNPDGGYRVELDDGNWCERLYEVALASEIKAGQRVLLVDTPKPESKFAVGMHGTILTDESGGVFKVRLDNGVCIWCDRSMVRFLEPDYYKKHIKGTWVCEKKPLLDETFILTSYASEGVHGGTAYDVKLRGLVNTPSVFGGGDLKLRLASMDGWDEFNRQRRFRVTVTPIEEAKFKVGDRVRTKWRPQPTLISDHCYLQGSGVVVNVHEDASGLVTIQLDASGLVTIHEDTLELDPKVKPCPFCQRPPFDDGQTLMCEACGRAATYEPTKEARVAAWNRRAK